MTGVQTCALPISTFQRGGVGRALVADAEAWARAAGAVRIEVTSNQRRLGAHAFYLALGYADSSKRFIKDLRS